MRETIEMARESKVVPVLLTLMVNTLNFLNASKPLSVLMSVGASRIALARRDGVAPSA
jgi:hypothetical protein